MPWLCEYSDEVSGWNSYWLKKCIGVDLTSYEQNTDTIYGAFEGLRSRSGAGGAE